MLSNDDRRTVSVQKENWVDNINVFENVLLCGQIKQDVVRLGHYDIYSRAFILGQKVRPGRLLTG